MNQTTNDSIPMSHALPDASSSDYVVIPCSFADSPIFREAPYSRFKLRLWLLMEAAHVASTGNRGLGPGRIDHSIRVIQEALAWTSEKLHREITPGTTTIMRDLKVLKEKGQIEIESVKGIGTVITICNWEHYQWNGEGGQEQAQEQQEDQTEECKKEWKQKFIQLGSDFPEAVSIYREEWMPHVPIRRSVKDSFQAQFRILDTLRLMHTQDGLPWDRIRKIVRHCARESYPQGVIGSPAKLRQPIQDGSMKFWERTEQIMEADKRQVQEKKSTNGMAVEIQGRNPTQEEIDLMYTANSHSD